VARAWIRQKYDASNLSTVTIIGPRNLQQLEDNLASLDLTLTGEQLERLNKASKVSLGSPHEIIDESKNNLFGRGTWKIGIKWPVR